MSTIRGRYIGGKIVPDSRPDWPEGTEVEVRPATDDDDPPGTVGPVWDNSPQGIADWLAWYESLEPLILTPEDEERIRSAREARKAFELATRAAHNEKLRKLAE
jgi:hypothetical protein